MSKLDVAKEAVAYLKLWLGVTIATGISLIGWLLANIGSAGWLRSVAGLLRVVLILIAVGGLHSAIETRIRQLEDL